jgi:hypothetical protein
VQWEKNYGDSAVNEEAFSVAKLKDGYALAGYKSPGVKGAEDVYILKVDTEGNLIWENTFGGSYRDRGVSIKETNDGGLIVAGWQDVDDSDLFQTDAYLLKLDSSGNKLWENNYGGASNDKGVDVVEAADGSFAITGITKSEDNEDEDLYLIRADAEGVVKWGKSFGGSGDDAGQSVIATKDGGFLALGWKEIESGNFDHYIVKTDADGNKEWEKNFGGPYEDRGRSFQATTDGGVIVDGNRRVAAAL